MQTTISSPFAAQVRAAIAERHLLGHPFYVAWTNGELSMEQLRQYTGQYMHHVLAEPTYISAVHSNTPHFASDGTADLGPRQTILQNLVDEELGPKNHPALWKQFAAAIGVSEQDLAAAPPLPATQKLIETFTDLCRNRRTTRGSPRCTPRSLKCPRSRRLRSRASSASTGSPTRRPSSSSACTPKPTCGTPRRSGA